MIKSLVEKLPDEAAALQLIEMFENLLKKYARQLGTEDAYECPIRFNGLPVSDERCGQFG